MIDNYIYKFYSTVNLEDINEIDRFKKDYQNDIVMIEIRYGIKIHLLYTGSLCSSYVFFLLIESLEVLDKKKINIILEEVILLNNDLRILQDLKSYDDYQYIPQKINLNPVLTKNNSDEQQYFIGYYYQIEDVLNIDTYIHMIILEQLFNEECSLFQDIRDQGISYLTISKFHRWFGRYLLGILTTDGNNTHVKSKIFEMIDGYVQTISISDLHQAKKRLLDKLILQRELYSEARIMPFIWHLEKDMNFEEYINQVKNMDVNLLIEYIEEMKSGYLPINSF